MAYKLGHAPFPLRTSRAFGDQAGARNVAVSFPIASFRLNGRKQFFVAALGRALPPVAFLVFDKLDQCADFPVVNARIIG